ncbi:hypothetical protein [Enterococcus sp. AZ007]|uniref:hypothetical protein n=1 Tax=Enterococcus sp. AZ007 TaxID=2774839 RepID=UPI003F1EBDB7
MRNDFEYVPTIPVRVARTMSAHRAEKTLLTGSIITASCFGFWKVAIVLLGVLTVVNVLQKRKKRLTSREA